MSHLRLRSLHIAASRLTNKEVDRGAGFPYLTPAILGVLLLTTVFLGACDRQGGEEPPSESVPTNTAVPLPATATNPPLPPDGNDYSHCCSLGNSIAHCNARSRGHRGCNDHCNLSRIQYLTRQLWRRRPVTR